MSQTALFQLLPELAADEFDELREDIRANGVRVPVDIDEHGNILDGHHRVRIANELGLDYETRVLSGLTDEQKRAHALAVNVHRRQLNREQKRELIRRSLAADPQLSDRQHAERTGSSHPTVASVRAGMEESGDVEKLSTRTDSTGRQQPSERQAAETVEIEGSQPLPVEFPAGNEWGAAFAKGIDDGEAAEPEVDERVAAKALVDAALAKHVPDPEAPKRQWRIEFLGAIGPTSRLMAQFPPKHVVANADDECLDELARLTDRLVEYRDAVRAARPIPDNVRHLRAVS